MAADVAAIRSTVAKLIAGHGAHNLSARTVREKLEEQLGVEPGRLKRQNAGITQLIDEVLQEQSGGGEEKGQDAVEEEEDGNGPGEDDSEAGSGVGEATGESGHATEDEQQQGSDQEWQPHGRLSKSPNGRTAAQAGPTGRRGPTSTPAPGKSRSPSHAGRGSAGGKTAAAASCLTAAETASTAALLRLSASVRQDRATPPELSVLLPSRGLRRLAPDGAGIPVSKKGRAAAARPKYIVALPGHLAPVAGGELGTIRKLDSPHPELDIGFEGKGILRLRGSLVHTRAKYLAMVPKDHQLLCDEEITSILLFSEARWLPADAPDGAPGQRELPPSILSAGLHRSPNCSGGGGATGVAGGDGCACSEAGDSDGEPQDSTDSDGPVRSPHGRPQRHHGQSDDGSGSEGQGPAHNEASRAGGARSDVARGEASQEGKGAAGGVGRGRRGQDVPGRGVRGGTGSGVGAAGRVVDGLGRPAEGEEEMVELPRRLVGAPLPAARGTAGCKESSKNSGTPDSKNSGKAVGAKRGAQAGTTPPPQKRGPGSKDAKRNGGAKVSRGSKGGSDSEVSDSEYEMAGLGTGGESTGGWVGGPSRERARRQSATRVVYRDEDLSDDSMS